MTNDYVPIVEKKNSSLPRVFDNCTTDKKKTRKSILTLFYKMTINNGTKKIEVPPKGIPCTCYVGSSVGRKFIVVRFLFLCARDFSVR